MIDILNPDLSPMTDVEIPALEAGQDSGTFPFALRNAAGGDDASDLLLVVQAIDPATGTWVSAGVVDLVDLRAFAADTVVLHLRGDLPGLPGEIPSQLVVHDGLVLEQVVHRLSGNGGRSAGQTQLDLQVDGVTIYTSFAEDDQRPSWAFDAAELVVADRIHEVTEMRAGGMVRLVSIEHPTGGTAGWGEAYLVCRRP